MPSQRLCHSLRPRVGASRYMSLQRYNKRKREEVQARDRKCNNRSQQPTQPPTRGAIARSHRSMCTGLADSTSSINAARLCLWCAVMPQPQPRQRARSLPVLCVCVCVSVSVCVCVCSLKGPEFRVQVGMLDSWI
eukprot:341515-Pelagomonas_calceolata.AAC.2